MIFDINIKQKLKNKIDSFLEEMKSIDVEIQKILFENELTDITTINEKKKKFIIKPKITIQLYIPDSLIEINGEE
jgi:hypothetical protein